MFVHSQRSKGIVAPQSEKQEKAIVAEKAPENALRALRVLAAEDNKTNQLVFRKMLKSLDIDLTFANNGVEAVELYQSFKPDVVFMDISMPKKDGKEATQDIRAFEKENNVHAPIIAMTAHAMAGDQDAILSVGLDHYLTKPLKKAMVVEQITNLKIEGVRPPLPD
jgi:CheY-like chemotaxis protein